MAPIAPSNGPWRLLPAGGGASPKELLVPEPLAFLGGNLGTPNSNARNALVCCLPAVNLALTHPGTCTRGP